MISYAHHLTIQVSGDLISLVSNDSTTQLRGKPGEKTYHKTLIDAKLSPQEISENARRFTRWAIANTLLYLERVLKVGRSRPVAIY